jgi:hypothetical protein
MTEEMIVMTDWAEMGRKLNSIQAAMIHDEQSELCGAEFTGEALRRMAEQTGHGLAVPAPDPAQQSHAGCHAALASVERSQREQYEKLTAALRDARHVAASEIRRNAHTVPSRLRREGVLLAAIWLDPHVTS